MGKMVSITELFSGKQGDEFKYELRRNTIRSTISENSSEIWTLIERHYREGMQINSNVLMEDKDLENLHRRIGDMLRLVETFEIK